LGKEVFIFFMICGAEFMTTYTFWSATLTLLQLCKKVKR